MKKIIIGIGVLVIIFIGYMTYQLQKDDNQSAQIKNIETSTNYYQNLKKECEQKNSKNCCLASVNRMEEIKALEIPKNRVCDKGYKREMMKCIDSFVWCKKE